MPFLERTQAKIYWQVFGESGPFVTLINGYMRSSRDFNLLQKKIVAKKMRVLLIDNRGTGQSTASVRFTLKDLAEDILAIWQEAVVQKSFVVGVSMGGLVAQILYKFASDKFLGLSLVSTTDDPKKIFSPREKMATQKEEIIKDLSLYVSKNFYKKNKVLLQAMAKELAKQFESVESQQVSLWQSEAIASFRPVLNSLSQTNCPVQLIHGSEDQIIPLAATLEIKAYFRNIKYEVFEAKGHLLLAEDFPGLFDSLISFWQQEGLWS